MTRWQRFWVRINTVAARYVDPVIVGPARPRTTPPDTGRTYDSPLIIGDPAPTGAAGFHPFRVTLYRGPEHHEIGYVGPTQVQADWNERFPYDSDGEF